MLTKPETYLEHEGTVRISGKTLPKQAAGCAYAYLQKGVERIEFFYIGANAGQQAMKAMTIFAHTIRTEMEGAATVAFEPFRVMTNTDDGAGGTIEKDATIWRTVLIQK